MPLSLLGLMEGSVVLSPTAILFLGSRGTVTPLVCNVMEVAVVAVVVVAAVATVVFHVWKLETVVGRSGNVLDSRASSSPVGPHAMNSVSVVGLLPRKSKLLKLADCSCLFPLLKRACWSVATPLPTAGDKEAEEVPREGLDLAAAGGLASPPLGTRAATWSLGLCTRFARGVCICPWLRSTRAGRGLHRGAGTRAGCPLLKLHKRGGRCEGRGSSRNSGPGPRASHAGRSMASWKMAISIQAWLPREQPGQQMDVELSPKSC